MPYPCALRYSKQAQHRKGGVKRKLTTHGEFEMTYMQTFSPTRNDSRFIRMREQLEAVLLRVTPLTREEREYNDALDAWTAESKGVSIEATRIAQGGDMRGARALLQLHNLKKPRLRKSRHARGLPPVAEVDAALLAALVDRALSEVLRDQTKASRREVIRAAALILQGER
jgi:hypothetical protein